MADTQPLVRQWLLLRMLTSRRQGVSVRELSEELGVVQKTIRRDLQTLARVGFPLAENTGEFGRKFWSLANGEACPDLQFDLMEALSLYLGRRFLEPLAGTYFWNGAQSAFRKIRASLGEQAIRYLEKIGAAFHQTAIGGGDYAQKAEIVDALMVGIEDRRFTSISYCSLRSTEPVTYDVYPYGLVFHRDSLYLVAFSPDHNELRHFKVDRISEAEVQDLRFNKPDNFDLAAHLSHSFGVYHAEGPSILIRVRFLPQVARYIREARRWHPSQKLSPQRDGSVIAQFELTTTEEIQKWILSFGTNAIVLEPQELRDDMATVLRTLLEEYESPRQLHTRRSSG